jgi:hypothetical protein|tara:strand:+ start:41 stop:511 length:471 start_codon:yes stop_codon:yes gene_type:complete
MGRAGNSFISYVGHAEETISDDKVTLPEKDLWVAVLCRAVLDACKGPPDLNMSKPANITHKNHYHYERDQARHFFMEGGFHFRLICEMAGRNPDYVQTKVKKVLLRKNGWNVDVPITSHYRQGPKRTRKKYRRTIPSDPYYSAMGKKGGRPKLYGI